MSWFKEKKKQSCCVELELEVTNLIGPLKAHPIPFHTLYMGSSADTYDKMKGSHFNQLLTLKSDSVILGRRASVHCLCKNGLKLIWSNHMLKENSEGWFYCTEKIIYRKI